LLRDKCGTVWEQAETKYKSPEPQGREEGRAGGHRYAIRNARGDWQKEKEGAKFPSKG